MKIASEVTRTGIRLSLDVTDLVRPHLRQQKVYCATGEGGGKDPSCSPGGGTSGGLAETKRGKDGKLTFANGEALPAHLPRIPPAWTDVTVSTDPNASLIVKGKDSKGRVQSVYSKTHATEQAAKKFAKVSELLEKQDGLRKEIEKDMKSNDPEARENASVLALIQQTGLRPGSERDTGAEKKAYGATTLEGRHVVELKRGVRLRFVGKKGVDLDILVDDPVLAKMLVERKQSAGNKGKLFDVTDASLREYTRTKDGGEFKPKDFRTAVGTRLASKIVSGMKAPKNQAQYKKSVREVGKQVAARLGNTHTIALQSYIDPSIFSKWRVA